MQLETWSAHDSGPDTGRSILRFVKFKILVEFCHALN